MITKKILNGRKNLFLRSCSAPFFKNGKAFKIPYLGDTPVSGEKPKPNEPAIPNGYGYFDGDRYVFRRVDRVWVVVSDENLAEVLSQAVDTWAEGVQLSFEDLQSLTGADSSVLSVAFCAGLLGRYEFPKAQENPIGPIRIPDGWFEENLFEYMAYRDGLALYEYWINPLPHILTAYSLRKPTLSAHLKNDRLVTGKVVVEDAYLLDIAEMCGEVDSVSELVQNTSPAYSEDVEWGLAVLVALGCVDLR